MPFPADISVIDTMIGIPSKKASYDFLKPTLMGDQRQESFPIGYMFKDKPEVANEGVDALLHEMDRHGIEKGMIAVGRPDGKSARAIKTHPDRLFGSVDVDPNQGMEAVRNLVQIYEECGIRAATSSPAMLAPPVPINDARYYPLYAKCVELHVPICLTVGVPGPRVRFAAQAVELLDEVCWFFPELTIVTRHGGEPWTGLVVKLLLKWPNLYYSTSAFAPKHYPRDIIDFANTRGADKVIYAGYFPVALTLDRIFAELPEVPFRDHVWEPFLRTNAQRVFGV